MILQKLAIISKNKLKSSLNKILIIIDYNYLSLASIISLLIGFVVIFNLVVKTFIQTSTKALESGFELIPNSELILMAFFAGLLLSFVYNIILQNNFFAEYNYINTTTKWFIVAEKIQDILFCNAFCCLFFISYFNNYQNSSQSFLPFLGINTSYLLVNLGFRYTKLQIIFTSILLFIIYRFQGLGILYSFALFCCFLFYLISEQPKTNLNSKSLKFLAMSNYKVLENLRDASQIFSFILIIFIFFLSLFLERYNFSITKAIYQMFVITLIFLIANFNITMIENILKYSFFLDIINISKRVNYLIKIYFWNILSVLFSFFYINLLGAKVESLNLKIIDLFYIFTISNFLALVLQYNRKNYYISVVIIVLQILLISLYYVIPSQLLTDQNNINLIKYLSVILFNLLFVIKFLWARFFDYSI